MAKKKIKKAKKKVAKKKPAKKSGKKKAKKSAKSKTPKKPKIDAIGVVTHYFPKVNAAVVKLKKPLAVGDTVLIQGSTTHFKQRIKSMQIDHVVISKAKKGDEIGLEVDERVREHDLLVAP